jgi:CBS domain-containing protein
MNKTMEVRQLMTKKVFFVRPDDTMDKVNDIFRLNNIHHVPVVEEGGKVIGIISKSDFFRVQHGVTLFKLAKAEEYNEAISRSLLVKEVMTTQVAKLSPEDSVDVAMGIFRENLFHAMPVVDKEDKLVGILSTFDLLNYAFQEEVFLEKP